MAQQNIDFGTFPDDPDADAIRTAFSKVQTNFTEVFAGVAGASVASVNRTAGAGITVSSPTGNVIVTANIACVQVHTSTLSIGRDSNGSYDTSITASSQTLWIDLPANISNVSNINLDGYANIVGNLTAGNIASLGDITVVGNANITSNLNVTGGIALSGNFSAGNLSTSGILSVFGNANVGNIGAATGVFTAITGPLTTAAQPNITSVGTLTSLLVTGNISSGNANLGNLTTSNYYTGVLTTAAQPNITSVGTLTSLAVTGNISSANANLGNLTTSNFFTGVLTTAAQPNITSTGTLSSLTVTGTTTSGNFATAGNLTASFVVSNIATGTAPLAVISTTRVANLNVNYANVSDFEVVTAQTTGTYYPAFVSGSSTANYALAANSGFSANLANGSLIATTFVGSLSGAATTAGPVTTAAQPNITSTGTLSSLTVTGTTTSGNFATSGNLTASFLVSNIATGAAPLAVTSTTRVANLNVNYANVSDFGVVTAQTTGTYYPVFVNGSSSANYAHAANSGFSANIANGALIATTFVGALSGAATSATTAGTVTTAAQPNITSTGTLSS